MLYFAPVKSSVTLSGGANCSLLFVVLKSQYCLSAPQRVRGCGAGSKLSVCVLLAGPALVGSGLGSRDAPPSAATPGASAAAGAPVQHTMQGPQATAGHQWDAAQRQRQQLLLASQQAASQQQQQRQPAPLHARPAAQLQAAPYVPESLLVYGQHQQQQGWPVGSAGLQSLRSAMQSYPLQALLQQQQPQQLRPAVQQPSQAQQWAQVAVSLQQQADMAGRPSHHALKMQAGSAAATQMLQSWAKGAAQQAVTAQRPMQAAAAAPALREAAPNSSNMARPAAAAPANVQSQMSGAFGSTILPSQGSNTLMADACLAQQPEQQHQAAGSFVKAGAAPGQTGVQGAGVSAAGMAVICSAGRGDPPPSSHHTALYSEQSSMQAGPCHPAGSVPPLPQSVAAQQQAHQQPGAVAGGSVAPQMQSHPQPSTYASGSVAPQMQGHLQQAGMYGLGSVAAQMQGHPQPGPHASFAVPELSEPGPAVALTGCNAQRALQQLQQLAQGSLGGRGNDIHPSDLRPSRKVIMAADHADALTNLEVHPRQLCW